MNKLSTHFRRVVLLFALFALSAAALAEFEEGLQYIPIEPIPPHGKGEVVEAVEFFWYGCPHCYQFEPHVKSWKKTKPENISFRRIPLIFSKQSRAHAITMLHARLFYTLQQMGELERVHDQIFRTIHVEKNRLATEAEVEAFLGKNGVDIDAYRSTSRSFGVVAMLNQSQTLGQRYGVRGVPSLVVDGRYRSGSGFRGYEQMTALVDYLVALVREERAAAAGGK